MTEEQQEQATEDLATCIAVFCTREEQSLTEAITEATPTAEDLPAHLYQAWWTLRGAVERGAFEPNGDDDDFRISLAAACGFIRSGVQPLAEDS